MGCRKTPILSIRNESFSLYRLPTLEPLIKRNQCSRQYSARLTRWPDRRLAHFDIDIQQSAGSKLKFTGFQSRNPVEEATTEDTYDEQYVINVLSEQAELNIKYCLLFANQYKTLPKYVKRPNRD